MHNNCTKTGVGERKQYFLGGLHVFKVCSACFLKDMLNKFRFPLHVIEIRA